MLSREEYLADLLARRNVLIEQRDRANREIDHVVFLLAKLARSRKRYFDAHDD
jgi:hypothetical protein